MKQIALLDYMFIFDPSEAWTSGSAFEAQLADFFAAFGFAAQIVEPRGNTGKRVIYLERVEVMPKLDNKPKEGLSKEVAKLNQREVPKSFKKFVSVKHYDPKLPKLNFKKPSNLNKQEVRGY